MPWVTPAAHRPSGHGLLPSSRSSRSYSSPSPSSASSSATACTSRSGQPVSCSVSPGDGGRSQRERPVAGYGIIAMACRCGRAGAALLRAGTEDWESFVRALVCLALLAIAVLSARAALASSLRTPPQPAGWFGVRRPHIRSSCAIRGRAAGRSRNSDWWSWHVARGRDRDARPWARPRRARPRRHCPGRRLSGYGGWGWLAGTGCLSRGGARSSLRVRCRGDAEPFRPRSRAGPPRSPPERVCLP